MLFSYLHTANGLTQPHIESFVFMSFGVSLWVLLPERETDELIQEVFDDS